MSKLDAIATDMRAMLAATGARYVHRRLNRGLELVLERRERGYRLALGRTDAPPSETEIEVCLRAFAAPPDIEPMRTHKERRGKSGPVCYHVAEFFWSELN